MIKSAAKVTVEETDAGDVITIYPKPAGWQIVALSLWAIIWTMAGVLAFVGGLKESSGDERLFLLVFMSFWAYFLFYAVRSIIWLRSGAEYLRLGAERLDYKRSWNGYGKVKSFDLQTIKNLGLVNYNDKPFAKSYNETFWTIGGEMIGFEYIGSKVVFGFKLTDAQAKDIVKRINQLVTRRKN